MGSDYLAHNVFSSLRVFGETDQDEARGALDQSQWEAFTLGKTALSVKEKNPLCELFSREQSQQGCSARSVSLPWMKKCSARGSWPRGAGNRSRGTVWAVTEGSVGLL